MFLIFKCISIEKLVLLKMALLLGVGICSRSPLAQIYPQAITKAPIILAAANIRLPLEEIAGNFENLTKIKPKVIYGSSGNFYQQILNGGKFDLFMSADEHFIDELQKRKKTQSAVTVYAKGRLVLWLSKKAFPEELKMDTIPTFLVSNRVTRVAIANPSLAPYGKAANQVLGKWVSGQDIQKKIIMGENVGQVAQFALSGSVEAAFLPVSLTMQAEMQRMGHVLLISDELYAPIMQTMALLSENSVAKDFYQFILDKQNKKIWEKYGYTVP